MGGKKSRGLGRLRELGLWQAYRYDLDSTDGWLRYADSDADNPLKDEPTFEALIDAVAAQTVSISFAPQPDARTHVDIHLSLRLAGTILIRTPGREAADPDVTHLTENQLPLISGTSFAGTLRSQCLKIANTIGLADPAAYIDNLFGHANENGTPLASRVLVSEAVIHDSKTYRQTRVKIDRFTGGALDTALFDEVPVAGGSASVSIRLLRPEADEIGILELAVRDFFDGFAVIGGGSAGGRGRVTGTYTVTRHNISESGADLANIQALWKKVPYGGQ